MADFAYQERGIEFMRAHPRCMNLDDMGLGKTRQALLAAEGRTLVVAPAMIRDMGVWQKESAKWAPGLDLTIAAYHDLPRREAQLVTSKEGKKTFRFKMTDNLNLDYQGHWDTVIFDEAHHLKSRVAHWSLASFQLQTDRMYLLTGTPIPNWAHELFMLLRHLRPEDSKRSRSLGSYWSWVERWFEVGPLKNRKGEIISRWYTSGKLSACGDECSRTVDSCVHWEDFRNIEFQGRWIRRLHSDVLPNLPPLIGADDLYPIPMEKGQGVVYRKLKKEMVAILKSGETLLAWNDAGLLTKLRKLATGLECVSDSGVGSGKLDALGELLANHGKPTLVVANYHSTLDAIGRRLDKAGLRWRELSGRTPGSIYRQSVGEAFQAGKLDVLLGQVDTVAEGLTLTRATLCIIVEHSWRPAKNEQVIRRIHRIGQTEPCQVIRLVTEKTVDENMQELLREKTEHQIRALPSHDWLEII
jgi:SNF2 family DNA or RNA helicase